MIKLPDRIKVADPSTYGVLHPYTIVQVLMNMDRYNAAESAYLAASAEAEKLLAPYRTPEGLRVPSNAPVNVREVHGLLKLPQYSPNLCRWPAATSPHAVTIGVAMWRQTTDQLNYIAGRLSRAAAGAAAPVGSKE